MLPVFSMGSFFFLLFLFLGGVGVVVISLWKEGLVLCVAELQHLLLY